MLKHKKMDHNLRFLVGGVVLFFAIIVVVALFSGLVLKVYWDKVGNHTPTEVYTITLANGFKGGSYSVYLNDSLLFHNCVQEDSISFKARKMNGDNALLVVNDSTTLVTPFNLNDKYSVFLTNREGAISADIKE